MKCKSIKCLSICFVLQLLLITFLSIPVQAASVVLPPIEPPFPVGLPDFPDYTNNLDVSMVERVRDRYLNLLLNSYGNDVSSNYIILLSHSLNSTTYTFTCFNNPELQYTHYIDRPNELTYRNLGQHYVLYIYDSYTQQWTDDNFAGGWINSFTVTYNDLISFGNGWVVDMAQDELYTTDGVLWWSKNLTLTEIGVTPLPPLPDLDNPEIDNPSNPTLPTQPPYDPTISVGENIGNWFSWLGSLLTNLFSNLLSNIKNFFSNLFNNLKSWLQSLKDEIRNGFQTLIDNLVSLFKPFFENIQKLLDKIKEKIEYLTEIPSAEDLQDILDDTAIFGLIDDLTTNVTGFTNSFNQVSEPSTFVIPVHLEELNDNPLFSNLTTQYIDLGIIDPVKTLLRLFASAMVTYGLIITIIDSIANYINGGGDE